MSECYEKARELGRLVLASELADRVRIAKELGDEKEFVLAQAKFDKFVEQVVDIFMATVTGEMPEIAGQARNDEHGRRNDKIGGHCGGCGRHG